MNIPWSTTAGSVDLVRLDPKRVQPWHGNARDRTGLNPSSCADLINDIAKDGENRVPVIVRRIPGDNLYFELVAGTRRHFAVTHLQNSDPNVVLVARVMTLTDQEAFRIADSENLKRNDVSAVERGRNYAWARDNLYDGRQRTLAAALGHEESWVSKYLRIAAIPDEVLAAFPSPSDLAVKPAYKLAQALDDPERRREIISRAKELTKEQAERKGTDPIPASQVLSRLLKGASSKTSEPLAVWPSTSGQPALTLCKRDREGLSFVVHKDADAAVDELLASFRDALMRFR